ncbi:hypothetical protein [Amantichitinum ursilacus]|uniref:Uncharacterized protein n=1 Tax=Amantichitinum ursilacus TaxID=857265 RepID=A0A0N0GR43_9NEIS|nr:hypothetical protein [Amantichitinum ursilacus]KPC55308.1 hypothetical protein WG78_01585 [Amantichitinum ursilacus]
MEEQVSVVKENGEYVFHKSGTSLLRIGEEHCKTHEQLLARANELRSQAWATAAVLDEFASLAADYDSEL